MAHPEAIFPSDFQITIFGQSDFCYETIQITYTISLYLRPTYVENLK